MTATNATPQAARRRTRCRPACPATTTPTADRTTADSRPHGAIHAFLRKPSDARSDRVASNLHRIAQASANHITARPRPSMRSELDKQHAGDDQPDSRTIGQVNGSPNKQRPAPRWPRCPRAPDAVCDADRYACAQHHRQQQERADITGDDHERATPNGLRCAQRQRRGDLDGDGPEKQRPFRTPSSYATLQMARPTIGVST